MSDIADLAWTSADGEQLQRGGKLCCHSRVLLFGLGVGESELGG
jgi:hypothetical protein